MRECDARAVADRGEAALVEAAGTAVAVTARQLLGSSYGRRIAVLVGPGLNGEDGRVAARQLRKFGAKVETISVADQPRELRGFDLVIDAAFGLGCSRPYNAPLVGSSTIVLAVDLPSGVDADTGMVLGRPLRADVTLALGALKYAHVDGESTNFVGRLLFSHLDIVAPTDEALIEDSDLGDFVRRGDNDHKWNHAVSVLAGSPLMPGAAVLVCEGALSAGASMVHLESHGKIAKLVQLPPEIVRFSGPSIDSRSRCVIAGPGLGENSSLWLQERISDLTMGVVLDADALVPETLALANGRQWIATPHQKEFERLSGTSLGLERLEAVRSLSRSTGCVILLKGPTTIVASPAGQVRVVISGTSALATAGSGDVLSGIIGASVARGHDQITAAALGAHLHGLAGTRLSVYESASHLATNVSKVLERFVVPPSKHLDAH